MKNPGRQGFTLIELLTVIAIIAILASMIFTVGPRMIERAKLASLENNFNQIRTELVAYQTKNPRGLPPGYGYVIRRSDSTVAIPDDAALTGSDMTEVFQLTPYMATINQFRNFKMYDPFALQGYDTDARGASLNPGYYTGVKKISPLEFLPVGVRHKTESDRYAFPITLYGYPVSGSPIENVIYQVANVPINEADYNMGTQPEVDKREEYSTGQRPFAYIPVYSGDAKIVRKYFDATSKRTALNWRPDLDATLNNIKFPAPKLDAFVLISVGPAESTGGILTPPQSFVNDVLDALDANETSNQYDVYDVYYVYALRAYYLATCKDEDTEKGNLIFDYRIRTNGKAKGFTLPDGTSLPGPIIYVYEGSK